MQATILCPTKIQQCRSRTFPCFPSRLPQPSNAPSPTNNDASIPFLVTYCTLPTYTTSLSPCAFYYNTTFNSPPFTWLAVVASPPCESSLHSDSLIFFIFILLLLFDMISPNKCNLPQHTHHLLLPDGPRPYRTCTLLYCLTCPCPLSSLVLAIAAASRRVTPSKSHPSPRSCTIILFAFLRLFFPRSSMHT
jgi:hypothetical protein